MAGNQRWGLYLLSRLLAPFRKNAWFLTSSVLLFAAITLGCLYLWQQHSESILNRPEFRLSENKLRVTPQPEWIRSTDVKADAMIRGRLVGMNIRDVDCSLRIARAFQNNAWVREVKLVNKSQARGHGVVVELEYRRPVAMVIVEGRQYGADFDEGLLPIDDEGVLLPQEFTQEMANQYLKIGGVNTMPVGTGRPWGDPRIPEAAEIASLLQDIWQDLGIRRLRVPTLEDARTNRGIYEMILANGTAKPWGHAPGKEAPGEPSAAEKVAILRQILNEPTEQDTARMIRETSLLELRWAKRR